MDTTKASVPRAGPSLQRVNGSISRDGVLADHVVTFGRVLRQAGVAVGSDQIVTALRALDLVDVWRKDDFYQALFCTFVRSRAQIEIFEQAFDLFWRARADLPDVLSELLRTSTIQPRREQPGNLDSSDGSPKSPPRRDGTGEPEKITATVAYSPAERLKKKDFAELTEEEIAEAQAFIRKLSWPFQPVPVRRFSRFQKGRRFDFRHTVRRGLRHHCELLRLWYGGRKRREQPVVLLCDVSGSMEIYSQMLLRFMHAVSNESRRVESFVFGTRLTRVTRHLLHQEVDRALSAVAEEVEDWAGGTRIGESIRTFNYVWLRRVVRSKGYVVIISDGCDRGDPALLDREVGLLARSCRSLLWLNPLLGYEEYQPLTRGMRAALPHVDHFLPVHNLESLEQLGAVLSRLSTRELRRR